MSDNTSLEQLMHPTTEDFQQLWQINPLANEQIQRIILTRLLLQELANASSQKDDTSHPTIP